MSTLQAAGLVTVTADVFFSAIAAAVVLHIHRGGQDPQPAADGPSFTLPAARDDLTQPEQTTPRHLADVEPDDTVEIDTDRVGRHSAEHLLVSTAPLDPAEVVAEARHVTVPPADRVRPLAAAGILGLSGADYTPGRAPVADWAQSGGAA